MKFFYSSFLFFFLVAFDFQASAGAFRCSEGLRGQEKIFPPADLSVNEISFISIYFDVNKMTYLVKVAVTIRNEGTLTSEKTKIGAYTKSADSPGSWKIMGTAINIPAISPGGSYKSEFSFKESILSVGTVSFDFRIKVDPGNSVTESDKMNNYSKSILINPRAY